jgi:hypothetical protein
MYSCIVDQHIDPGIFLKDGRSGLSDISQVGEICLKDAYAGLTWAAFSAFRHTNTSRAPPSASRFAA